MFSEARMGSDVAGDAESARHEYARQENAAQ